MYNSRFPRINEGDGGILKMLRVASCQSGVMCQRDSGDHGVAQLNRTAFLVPRRHQFACVPCCFPVEPGNALADPVQELIERLNEGRAAPPAGQNLQSELDL